MIESTYVLFGATGDLARRKILPSICNLFREQEAFPIIAIGREECTSEKFRTFLAPSLSDFSEKEQTAFLGKITYYQGTLDDSTLYTHLKERIGTTHPVIHLSLPPGLFSTTIENMGKAGITGTILLEKPFGTDLATAKQLETTIEQYFPKTSIFRIDHYFSKEGLQKLLDYKKEHSEFQAALRAPELVSVVCHLYESLDIQGRGNFYDSVGALRDVGQNHLLLMLATALLDIDSYQDTALGRAEVLSELVTEDQTLIRAQYREYREQEGVRKQSNTETYFKIETTSINPLLAGVSIVLEAGKKMSEKKTEVIFSFKDGTKKLFDIQGEGTHYDYTPLLKAALLGNTALFTSIEEILASWNYIDVTHRALIDTPLTYY